MSAFAIKVKDKRRIPSKKLSKVLIQISIKEAIKGLDSNVHFDEDHGVYFWIEMTTLDMTDLEKIDGVEYASRIYRGNGPTLSMWKWITFMDVGRCKRNSLYSYL